MTDRNESEVIIQPVAAEPTGDDPDMPGSGRGIVLSWLGRRQARVAIPKPRILEPMLEHSDVTEEDPGNLVIEGDNRQAMVSLLPQYAGSIDVVLIDPPYNTGKGDFRYNDARFHDPDADTNDGDFVSAEDGGRHAKWLNQMAPTLRIIRDLMAPHGVIFIHISDIELPRLLLLMEEIFDEKNRLGMLVWKSATDNNPSQIATEHEYVVCWARNKGTLPTSWRGQMGAAKERMLVEYGVIRAGCETDAEVDARWKAWVRRHKKEIPTGLGLYEFADLRAPFRGGDLQNPGAGDYHYDLIHPATGKPCREPLFGWRYPEDRMTELIASGRVLFGRDETTIPQYRRYLTDSESEPLRSVITLFGGKAVNADVRRLFPEKPDTFESPKPVPLEEFLLSFVAGPDDVILDSFAGSGTTGHAVMRLNKRDGGHRRFILIEEGSATDAFATTLTAERLRRARTNEHLPGGFSFLRVGPRINVEAFMELQHRHLVQTILQTDASGRGGGISAVTGARWVIGCNARREAICLHYNAKDHDGITAETLREMYEEADALGLKRPLRVYGESCEVFRSESFRFFKLPDEVTNNLTMSLRGSA